MNGIRKLVLLAVTMAPSLLAMPAMGAPAKLYSVVACVGTFDAADPRKCLVNQVQGLPDPQTISTPIQVRLFNESPPTSNSTISSADFFVNVNWNISDASIRDNSGSKLLVDWTTTPGHIMVSNLAPVKPMQHVTVMLTVDNVSCGDGKWDAVPYTGSSFKGSTFGPATGYTPPTTSVACGLFDCGKTIANVQPQGSVATNDPHYVQLTRGTYDQDGTTTGLDPTSANCSYLFAYVTPTVTSSAITVHTIWDQGLHDSDIAVFRYVVNLRSTTNAGPPTIELAWLGAPDFQPALPCDANLPDSPMPYTTLLADNGGKIQVDPPTLPATVTVPFPIVIEQERMLVTKIITNTNTWFVTRAQGGTTQVTHDVVGTPVMSTPFPIVKSTDHYPSSYVGKPALMCIATLAQTFTGLPPAPTNQWTATVIDGGDGYVKGSF